DGRIAELGPGPTLASAEAHRTVDAGGLVLAPGFLDPHTHFDAQLTWDGLAQPSLEHGVTTVIPGNCSLSLAPLRSAHREFLGAVFRQIEEMPKSAFDAGLRWTWESFGEYVEAIAPGLGLNVAPLAGHSLLRLFVLGYESRDRASTPEEVRALQDLLRRSLDEGALGMSTSFSDVDHEFRPVPSRLATLAELDALCAVLGERGRPLQVLPEFWEADLLRTRIDMLAELSLRHGIPVHFSPLFESEATPGLVEAALERLELQARRGARVTAQMQTRPIDITFDASQASAVFAAMPLWMGTLMQGPEAIRKAFSDPSTRKALVADSETENRPIALSFTLAQTRLSAAKGASRSDVGRTLGEIARERGVHPAEVLMDVSLAEDLAARFTAASLAHADESKVGPALTHPLVQIGAGDGGAHVARFATYGDTGHLFARFVRANPVFDVEGAVKRLTKDIADAWGIADRGRLAKGLAADLVLFDPDTIDRGPEELAFDLPGGGDAFRFVRRARGVKEVFVAGTSVHRDGEGYSQARPGAIVEGPSR
ncbi:MAG TPA: amidohydrolase family protein, partial [Myxococcota bacterium]|nr:amidohydrolase family protein [Myxococcota bacterium]